MKIIVTITKEDVLTRMNGKHFEIECGNIVFNFTPDAMKEFVDDYNNEVLIKVQKKQNSRSK